MPKNRHLTSDEIKGASGSIQLSSGLTGIDQTFTQSDNLLFDVLSKELVLTDGTIKLSKLGTTSNGFLSVGEDGEVIFVSDEVGIEFEDRDITPNPTSGDNQPTGVFITNTPFSNSNVRVLVNGLGVNIGDGEKTKDCYFSSDSGVTAKLISNITSGDEIYWNGNISGYELDQDDLIDILYDASSKDV